jgi:hypothetical protein
MPPVEGMLVQEHGVSKVYRSSEAMVFLMFERPGVADGEIVGFGSGV